MNVEWGGQKNPQHCDEVYEERAPPHTLYRTFKVKSFKLAMCAIIIVSANVQEVVIRIYTLKMGAV